jgi:hypothetical protein
VKEVKESDIVDLFETILGSSYAGLIVQQYIVTASIKLTTRLTDPASSSKELLSMATYLAKIRSGGAYLRRCPHQRFVKSNECLERPPRSGSQRLSRRRSPPRPPPKICFWISWATQVHPQKPMVLPTAHKVKTCLRISSAEADHLLRRHHHHKRQVPHHNRTLRTSWISLTLARPAHQPPHNRARRHKQRPWISLAVWVRHSLLHPPPRQDPQLIPCTTRTTFRSLSK